MIWWHRIRGKVRTEYMGDGIVVEYYVSKRKGNVVIRTFLDFEREREYKPKVPKESKWL